MAVATDYFDLAPRTPLENAIWREKLLVASVKDKTVQGKLRQACLDDILFFFQFGAFLIEPRGKGKIIPFCLWPHQMPAILALAKSIEDGSVDMGNPIDVVFDKSRGQGATWICLYAILWLWLKEPMFAAGIISRSEEAVDKRNYPGSLFPKLDWAISMLPPWLKPKGFQEKRDRNRGDHVWFNCENGAVIAGTACTAEAFSGDRLTVLFYDEAAKVGQDDFQAAMDSTQHVTNVRWIVSTHYGDSGPFYEMVFGEGTGVKVVLDWKENPVQNRLLYCFRGGSAFAARDEEVQAVQRYVAEHRAELDRLKRRGFVKEGRLRSPWYDSKCLQKGATPRGIAQDLDRDPRSTIGKLFNIDVMDEMEKNCCQPPLWQGDAVLHEGEIRLVEAGDGNLKLWFKPGLQGEPPRAKYAVGSDSATGLTGPDCGNSALIAANAETGEQVLEYVVQIPETRFAHFAVAFCEWLYEALLIPESQGTSGRLFMNTVLKEIGYWNVYRREAEEKRSRKKTDQFGWVNNTPKHKRDLFEDTWIAMQDGDFTPRSFDLIAECRGWEEPEPNKIVYHGTGHGDRAIAAGLCRKGLKEVRGSAGTGVDKQNGHSEDDLIECSLAGRMARRQEREKRDEDDDFAGFRRVVTGRW